MSKLPDRNSRVWAEPPKVIIPGTSLGQRIRDILPKGSDEAHMTLLIACAWGIFSAKDASAERKQTFINIVARYIEGF